MRDGMRTPRCSCSRRARSVVITQPAGQTRITGAWTKRRASGWGCVQVEGQEGRNEPSALAFFDFFDFFFLPGAVAIAAAAAAATGSSRFRLPGVDIFALWRRVFKAGF